ncbi:hypothetical protein BDZ97DRAFT_1978751 [Flammula alnicola]|nr:hypothetical protein BDZ97DRAFT_1978751 [Flammula alnicola]
MYCIHMFKKVGGFRSFSRIQRPTERPYLHVSGDSDGEASSPADLRIRNDTSLRIPSIVANIRNPFCQVCDYHWTSNDLAAYNIDDRSPPPIRGPPSSDIRPTQYLRNRSSFPDLYCPSQRKSIRWHLSTPSIPRSCHSGQLRPAIDDFAEELLRLLGFEERGTLQRSRYSIPFMICGDDKRSAQTDLYLVQGTTTILLVIQEDKTEHGSRSHWLRSA